MATLRDTEFFFRGIQVMEFKSIPASLIAAFTTFASELLNRLVPNVPSSFLDCANQVFFLIGVLASLHGRIVTQTHVRINKRL
jgi:hypothetical protein